MTDSYKGGARPHQDRIATTITHQARPDHRTRGRGLRLWTAYLFAAALVTACGGGRNQDATVPVPTVEAVKVAGLPLNATTLPLQTSGYIEEEFYIRGKANRYRIPDPMGDAKLIDGGHPFVTRALVRRPSEAARFNGTVVVEWLNVTIGQDIDFVFGGTRELLLREGYAWVGVSVQRTGVEALTRWNPQRYGALSVAASNIDPANGREIDPPAFPAIGGDVLGWDVYSQVGAAIASGATPILGSLAVKKIIAAGESQSAFRLTAYYNSFQALHRVYDGFLLYDRGGPMRGDVGVKLVGIGTEAMNGLTGSSPPADTDLTRWWEIAGASHVSLAEMGYLDPIILRDGALRTPNGIAINMSAAVGSGNCTATPIWSRVPNADILKAGLAGLNTWIAGGAAPTKATRMVMASQGQLLRDADGRVAGGIRTAAYDAPMAVNAGVNGGGALCALAGSHLDFTPAEMCRRYGSATAYVAKVQALADVNVKDGMLLPAEAKSTVDEAKARAFVCAGG